MRECHNPTFTVLLLGEKHATYLHLKVMLYYGYGFLLYGRFHQGFAGGNHEYVGTHIGEMWIDLLGLTDPTRRLEAGGCILFLLSESPMMTVAHLFWEKQELHVSNGFPLIVVKILNV